MTSKFATGLLAVALLTRTAMADWVVEQEGEVRGRKETTTISIKGPLVRYDRPQRAASWIVDTETGDCTVISHAAKNLRRMTAKELADTRKQTLESAPEFMRAPGGPLKPLPQEPAQKIAGFDTQCYTWSHPSGVTMKLRAAGGPLKALGELLQKTEDAMQANGLILPGMPRHQDLGGVILQTEMNWGNGQPPSVLTTVSVKETPVKDATFELPGDYQELKAGR